MPELVSSLSNNKTLVQLVGLVPGLLDTLTASAADITVLAPSDSAFAALPPALVTFLTDPNNVDTLATVLKYHVISNTSDLAGEKLPPSIQIDSVLVPPSLQAAVAQIASSASMPTPTRTGYKNIPSWLKPRNPGNNWT